MRHLRHAVRFFAVLLSFVTVTNAAIPTTFTYQGSLKQNGTPVNGTYPIEFRITDANGNLYWTSGVQNVSVAEGLYKQELSPSGVNWDTSDAYLELRVNGNTFLPREKLTTAPYAWLARDLDSNATAKGDLTVKGKLTVGPANRRAYFYPNASEALTLENAGNVGTYLTLYNPSSTDTVVQANGLILTNKSRSIIGNVSFTKYANGYAGNDQAGIPYSNSARIATNPDNIDQWVWNFGTANNNGLYFTYGNPLSIIYHFTSYGQILAGTQNQLYPTYSFYGDENTGMFRGTAPDTLNFSTNGQTRMTFLSNGRVGIGTTAPSEFFHVMGRTIIDGPLTATGETAPLYVTGGGDMTDGRMLVFKAPWTTSSAVARYFIAGYDVTNVMGFAISGKGVLYQSSSRAFKDDIRSMPNPLSIVSRLNGVSYKWKGDSSNKRALGFIAEDLAQVIPEAVKDNTYVDYAAVIPVLVECIKELKTRVEQLEGPLADKPGPVGK